MFKCLLFYIYDNIHLVNYFLTFYKFKVDYYFKILICQSKAGFGTILYFYFNKKK